MDIMRYGGSPFGYIKFSAVARKVHFDNERMYVTLTDEREISVPLKWFPILQHATPEQRNQWELVHDGIGLRWEEIDEDISLTLPCLKDRDFFFPLSSLLNTIASAE